MVQIFYKPYFMRNYKKLHTKQRSVVDDAIRKMIADPLVGEAKLGDLTGIRVYKFHMVRQQILLAYIYEDKANTLTLLAMGPHENFYRDLKNLHQDSVILNW